MAWFLGDCVYWYVFAPRLIGRMKEENKETLSELIAAHSRGWTGAPLRIAALMIVLFVGLYCVSQFLAAGKAVTSFFDTPQLLTLAGLMVVSLGRGAPWRHLFVDRGQCLPRELNADHHPRLPRNFDF